MKSLRNLCLGPAAIPLVADEVLELHAARLLLLVAQCGTRNRTTGCHRIDGLTKMAKLDFFVRYPAFFGKIAMKSSPNEPAATTAAAKGMVRHHYGPWDKRYYHVLAYLEARGLLSVARPGTAIRLSLTEQGEELATLLAQETLFETIVRHMRAVKAELGNKTGTALKKLIYKVFQAEVAELNLGEVIQQ